MIITFDDAAEFTFHLRAAARAAHPNPTVERQNGVFVEFEGGRARFVATCGHWLWVSEVEAHEVVGRTERGSQILIPLERVECILKVFGSPKKAHRAWRVELDTDEFVRRKGAAVSFKPSKAQFPPYKQIIPPSYSLTGNAKPVAFDPFYLAAITASFFDVAGKNHKNGIGLVFQQGENPLGPVAISCDKAPRALAVLMPRREEYTYGRSLCDRYRATLVDEGRVAS